MLEQTRSVACADGEFLQERARRYERLVFISEDLAELLRVRLRGDKEGRGVLVLDEVHRWANSRTWDSDESGEQLSKSEAVGRRLELVKWFSAHRHYGWEVYLGTQTEETIDRQIRKLAEYIVICRNLRRFRVWGIKLFPFNFFMALWCWNDQARTIMRRQAYPLKRRVARLYSTHGLAIVDEPQDPIWLPQDIGPGSSRREGAGGGDGRTPAPAAPPARVRAVEEAQAEAGEFPWVVS